MNAQEFIDHFERSGYIYVDPKSVQVGDIAASRGGNIFGKVIEAKPHQVRIKMFAPPEIPVDNNNPAELRFWVSVNNLSKVRRDRIIAGQTRPAKSLFVDNLLDRFAREGTNND